MQVTSQRATCLACDTVGEVQLVTDAPISVAAASMKDARCQHCGSDKLAFGGEYPGAPKQTRTVEERVSWWLMRGASGVSSKTICSAMTGAPEPRFNADCPHDPDDYSRCRRLLDLIPEWRANLSRVSERYPWMKPFVDAWGDMDALWDEESLSGKCPKLYALMQRLEVESLRIRRPKASVNLRKDGSLASWHDESGAFIALRVDDLPKRRRK